jgi:L-alanine-DL-glutamate epimerase-like enolase superfamily enzyme
MALLDLWGHVTETPLYKLIGVENVPKPSFYTVGLDELPQMIESAHFGLKHTPYLKIKLNRDIDRCVAALKALKEVMVSSGKPDWKVRCAIFG